MDRNTSSLFLGLLVLGLAAQAWADHMGKGGKPPSGSRGGCCIAVKKNGKTVCYDADNREDEDNKGRRLMQARVLTDDDDDDKPRMITKDFCDKKAGTYSNTAPYGSKCNAARTACVDIEGTVVDDPHFVGFGHERYDFMGEANKVYSIISERSTQVNSRMISLAVPGEDGTYLGTTGVVYQTEAGIDRISITPEEGSMIEVIVNGELQTVNPSRGRDTALPSGARLQLLSSHGDVVDVARLVLDTMTLDFVGLGHHLDMVVERVAPGLCAVHGVLGQTYQGLEYLNGAATEAERAVALAKEFFIERKNHPENDYMVSGIFATDDLFNSFGRDCGPDPVSAAAAAAASSLNAQDVSNRKILSVDTTPAMCAGGVVSNAKGRAEILCKMLRRL